jgi:hypothetical protein
MSTQVKTAKGMREKEEQGTKDVYLDEQGHDI